MIFLRKIVGGQIRIHVECIPWFFHSIKEKSLFYVPDRQHFHSRGVFKTAFSMKQLSRSEAEELILKIVSIKLFRDIKVKTISLNDDW